MEKKINFNDYEWHDAIIENISIDRKNPGHNDIITFDIEWVNNTRSQIIFYDVFEAHFLLNFGIIANESIAEAYVEDSNDFLDTFKKSWFKIPYKIYCYIIKTSSTGDTIKIIAKNFIEIKQ